MSGDAAENLGSYPGGVSYSPDYKSEKPAPNFVKGVVVDISQLQTRIADLEVQLAALREENRRLREAVDRAGHFVRGSASVLRETADVWEIEGNRALDALTPPSGEEESDGTE